MSVRKRKWINKAGVEKEAWVVDYVDQNGRRSLKTFDRKKDADSYAAKTHTEVLGNIHIPEATSRTVQEAGALWIISCEAAQLERSTLAQYRQHLERHITPYIGKEKLARLTVPVVRAFLDRLRGGDDTLDTSDLTRLARSDAMVRNVRVSLGSILSDAQERGLVIRNAVKEMGRERRTGRSETRHEQPVQIGVDIPTVNEVRSIIKAAEGRNKAFLMTAALTGMRASELRGLRWDDVDLSRKTITIRQRADGYQRMGSPKSKSGRRTIPLVSDLVRTLSEWQVVCPKGDLDLVFPNGEGNLEWHANIIKRWVLPVQVKAGVVVESDVFDDAGNLVVRAKYQGLHALRHFYASWCINPVADGGLGLPPKVVQHRLGHSSIQMTLDVYGHLFPRDESNDSMDRAASAMLA